MNEGGILALSVEAVEAAPYALASLVNLHSDGAQPGAVRVAAARAVIDYALKLNDKVDSDQSTLQKLDALLAEVRGSAGADEEAEDGF